MPRIEPVLGQQALPAGGPTGPRAPLGLARTGIPEVIETVTNAFGRLALAEAERDRDTREAEEALRASEIVNASRLRFLEIADTLEESPDPLRAKQDYLDQTHKAYQEAVQAGVSLNPKAQRHIAEHLGATAFSMAGAFLNDMDVRAREKNFLTGTNEIRTLSKAAINAPASPTSPFPADQPRSQQTATDFMSEIRSLVESMVLSRQLTGEQGGALLAETEMGINIGRWEKFVRTQPEKYIDAFLKGETPPEMFQTVGPTPSALTLDKPLRDRLFDMAKQSRDGRRAEEERDKKLQEASIAEMIVETQDDFVAKLSDDTLTTQEILDSDLPPIGEGGSKQHFISLLDARAKEKAKPIRTDPSTFIRILNGIRTGAITQETLIEQEFRKSAASGVGVDWANVLTLRTELRELRTPEGRTLIDAKKRLIDKVQHFIDKSNPILGKLDFDGQRELLRYMEFVDREVDRLRSEGRNPHVLFDSRSDEWLGRDVVLNPFRKDLQESIRSTVEAVTRKRIQDDIDGKTKKVEPRREGETAADRLREILQRKEKK